MPRARPLSVIVTCEHGGNRVPPRYATLFSSWEPVLASHRGQDIGSLALARVIARRLDAPLHAARVTRLLVDLNRSLHHRALFSEITRPLPAADRQRILERYYLPHRGAVEGDIAQRVAQGKFVLHLAAHSFTPVLDDAMRRADFGLLYDPTRKAEKRFCALLRATFAVQLPSLRVRRNYPYLGTADGFTTHLRRRFADDRYAGVELELNQHFPLAGGQRWRQLLERLGSAVAQAVAEFAVVAESARGR